MRRRIIPDMMQEAGVQCLNLRDGSTVEVKPFYAAKIPESSDEKLSVGLRDNGHGDHDQKYCNGTLDRGQDNQVSELIKVCEDLGFQL